MVIAITDVEQAVADLLGGFTTGLSDHEVNAGVEATFRLQNMRQALRLKLLAEARVRRSWEQADYTKGKVWLAETGCITTTEADNQLQLARQLETAEHEPINHALAAGAVSAGHARQITQRLTTLPGEADHATRGRIRDQLLAEARWLDPKALGHRAEGILEVEAPEVAQDEEERRAARFVERAERRSLEIIRNADNHGMARIRGFLPAPEAEVLHETLHRIAYPPNTPTDETDLRTHEQRLCDAFCAYIAGDRSAHAEQAGEPASRPRLKITIALDQLQNGHGAGYLEQSGQPLPVETIRQAACDAGIIPAVLNSHGVPLDLGREQRLVPAKLRQALELRDRGCIFPGCQAPLTRVDVHHVTPWEHGGRTDINNTVLLCRRHHTYIHHSHWTITIQPGEHPELQPPPTFDGTPTRPIRQHQRQHRQRQDTDPDETDP